MSSSRKKTVEKKELLEFFSRPKFQSPSMVIGWDADAAWLGAKVTDYLNKKLGGQPFCEIEPLEFFSLAGVTIESDLVQFPESIFYACPDSDLVIFKSTAPGYEWYKFLENVYNQFPQEIKDRIEQRKLDIQDRAGAITKADEEWLKEHIDEFFEKEDRGDERTA